MLSRKLFQKNRLDLLMNFLGLSTIAFAALALLAGFFLAVEEAYDAWSAVGLVLLYSWGTILLCGFAYVVLAAIYYAINR